MPRWVWPHFPASRYGAARPAQDEVPLQNRAALITDVESPRSVVHAADGTATCDEQPVGREDVEIRSGVRELGQRSDPLGQIDVVRVEDEHEVAGRLARRGFLRGRLASVLLMQEDDFASTGREAPSRSSVSRRCTRLLREAPPSAA